MKAVIVLGSGVGLDGSIGPHQKEQVQKAYDLIVSGDADILITCGSYGYKQDHRPVMTEAQAYKNYAVSIGVPIDKIYTEEKSMETVGNLLFAKTDIMIPNNWIEFVVIPGYNHSDERVEYITHKVFGPKYMWSLVRANKNEDPINAEREKRSMKITTDINDPISDGDHEVIWATLYKNHPAYNPNSVLKLEDLKNQLSH